MRFGPLPADYLARMEPGTSEDFDVRATRLAEARSIEQVFFPDPAADQEGK